MQRAKACEAMLFITLPSHDSGYLVANIAPLVLKKHTDVVKVFFYKQMTVKQPSSSNFVLNFNNFSK